MAVLGGVAGNPGLDRGPSSSASPLPTAITASRFYRIDRAQVSTQGLLQNCRLWGPMSPVLLGCPAQPDTPVSADGQCTGMVLTAGSWVLGWLVGSLKAQASSSLTLKERCFGSEAGAPGKGFEGKGAASWGPCMRSEDLGQEGRRGGGWAGGVGCYRPGAPHHCSTSRPGFSRPAGLGVPCTPHRCPVGP